MTMSTSSKRDYMQERQSHIPKGAARIQSKKSSAVAYVYTRADRPYALGFSGRCGKPAFHQRFSTDEARARIVAQWIRREDDAEARKQARKAERAANLAKRQEHLKAGDILSASYGYDQTNVLYFQVLRAIGRRTVEIQEIGCMSQETAFMQGESVPVRDAFLKGSKPMRRRVDEFGNVKIFSWGCYASKVEPVMVAGVECFRPKHWTAYA